MKIEYHNLYTHYVFVTLYRQSLLRDSYRVRIEKYITGIVKQYESRLYAIYANPEHVHLLVSRSPKISEEDLAAEIANSSARFINENKLCIRHFAWQQSAAAFSVSKSDVNKVCRYILNQPHHHRKISFEAEYNAFIRFYQHTLHWESATIRAKTR